MRRLFLCAVLLIGLTALVSCSPDVTESPAPSGEEPLPEDVTPREDLTMDFTFEVQHDAETSAELYAEFFGDAVPGDTVEIRPGNGTVVPDYNPFFKTAGQAGQLRHFLDSLTPQERELIAYMDCDLGEPGYIISMRAKSSEGADYLASIPLWYTLNIAYSSELGDYSYNHQLWSSENRMTGPIKSGRRWAPQEFATGGTVVLHSLYAQVHSISLGDTVDVFGAPHELIGTYANDGPIFNMHVPLNSLLEETPLRSLSIGFEARPTRAEYNAIYDKVDAAFGFAELLALANENGGADFSASFEPTD